MNAEYHNPDGLTDEQVETDKGWRLLLDSEVIDNHLDIRFRPELQVWRAGVWLGWGTFTGHILATTYRTRRPLPESTTEPKEGGDALWSQNAGTVVSATDPTKLAPSNAAAGTSNPDQQAASVQLPWLEEFPHGREALVTETDQAPPQESADDGVKWPYNDPRFVGYFSGVPVNGRGHRIHPPTAPAVAEQEPQLFRKKPVVIEAIKWTGWNAEEMRAFGVPPTTAQYQQRGRMLIPTLEGEMTAQVGDWIIKGVKGEFYPCKPDIFVSTYEPAAPVAVGETPDTDALLTELHQCLASWAPDARVLGNVRAGDILRALHTIHSERDAARRERDEAMKAAEDWAKLHLGDYREIISALGMRQELLPVVKAGDFVNQIKALTAERDRLREENAELHQRLVKYSESPEGRNLFDNQRLQTANRTVDELESALATAQADIVKLCIVIAAAFAETTKPLNASVEYDATPTAAERLKKVQEILSSALDAASATEGGQP